MVQGRMRWQDSPSCRCSSAIFSPPPWMGRVRRYRYTFTLLAHQWANGSTAGGRDEALPPGWIGTRNSSINIGSKSRRNSKNAVIVSWTNRREDAGSGPIGIRAKNAENGKKGLASRWRKDSDRHQVVMATTTSSPLNGHGEQIANTVASGDGINSIPSDTEEPDACEGRKS